MNSEIAYDMKYTSAIKLGYNDHGYSEFMLTYNEQNYVPFLLPNYGISGLFSRL